ncbi:MAG: hypothetical protein EP315_06985 [Gammaproteobacteria bacterium]|nr:MAG: hypothetical protein EP315_06985 [Gammaproteobacteria bacterium]
MTWDTPGFNYMASLLVKDLLASANNGPVASTIGFGGNLSDKLRLPYGDYPNDFMFSVTYGTGIGSHFQNAKPDAVYDTTSNTLVAINLYGVTLGYSHSWNANTTSTLVYCCIEIGNDEAKAADAIRGTVYTTGNLVGHVNPDWLFAIEGIWGKRDDKDGAEATEFRTQFTSRLSF